MLRIWGRRNSVNTQKVMWCIAELQIEHERLDAGLQYGKNNEPWFLQKNPNGRVPLLEDGPLSLWESNTIVRYLCAKHAFGSLYPESLEQRAYAERWMDWQLSVLAQPMYNVFWNLVRLPAEARDPSVVQRDTDTVNRAMELLDGHLRAHDYVAGKDFTMGDIPVGALAHRWLALPGVQRPPLTHLRRWYERLRERAPYREHVMLPLS